MTVPRCLDRPSERFVLAMPHRIRAGQGIDGPPVRLFGQTLALDRARTVRSLTLPNDPRVDIYAITLM